MMSHLSPRPLLNTRLSNLMAGCLFALAVCIPQSGLFAEEKSILTRVIERVSLTRQLAMLRPVCPEGSLTVEDGVPGCSICPDFTSLAGDKSFFAISNVIEGNFTHPDAFEAMLDMEGCESHSDLYGGAVVIQREKGGWERLLYKRGLRPTECLKFRTIFRTVSLACNVVDSVQGILIGKLQWVDLRNGDLRLMTLFRWYDNMQGNPRQLISVFPDRFLKADFNQDGRIDLRASLRVRNTRVPDRYEGAIDAIDGGYKFPEPETIQLIYLFNGEELKLSPQSEKAKQSVDRIVDQQTDRR